MYQNAFGGRVLPGTLGSLQRSPISHSWTKRGDKEERRQKARVGGRKRERKVGVRKNLTAKSCIR